jgi:hypothetical protein
MQHHLTQPLSDSVNDRRDAARSSGGAWKVILHHQARRIETTCTDLSLTGMGLNDASLAVGSRVEAEIIIAADRVIHAQAEVVRRGPGAGLRFTHLGQAALTQLFSVLESRR